LRENRQNPQLILKNTGEILYDGKNRIFSRRKRLKERVKKNRRKKIKGGREGLNLLRYKGFRKRK
jgi:hypothetical protein